MTGHHGIVVRALTWNLFHGRDVPLDGDWRRPLRAEFARLLASFEWDVALLQEAPPRWFTALSEATGAPGRMLKTSRNQLAPLRGLVAERWPDLIKSNEGGSNQVLCRAPWAIADQRELTLARLPERRRMQWLRLTHPSGAAVCVANLHATANKPARAAHEVERAARAALEWSGGSPLLFGGDLNVRPSEDASLYERLAALGLSGPTAATAIDHLMAHRMRVLEAPRQLAPEERELTVGAAQRVRLSDHAVVVAAFEVE